MNANKGKSSFLIPSYNDNDFLLRTLESIDNEGIHILIVDDGSEVRVEKFISNYNFNSEITVVTLEENQGIIRALNEGLLYLKENMFRYIFRIDAGDININGRVDKQLEFLVSKKLGMLGGHVEYYTNDNKFAHYLPIEDVEIKRLQYMRSCFIHPSVVFDLDKIDGLYSENFKYAEDYELFLRVLKHPGVNVGNLDEIVVQCLVRSDGISLSNRRKQIVSVIKAQVVHFDVKNKYSYLGVFKSILLLVLPYGVVEKLKSIYRHFKR